MWAADLFPAVFFWLVKVSFLGLLGRKISFLDHKKSTTSHGKNASDDG